MANPTEQDIQKDAGKIVKDSIAEVLPKILGQIQSKETIPVVLDGKVYKEITKEEQAEIAAAGETPLVRRGFNIIGINPKTGEEMPSGSLTQNYWENRMMDGVKDAVRAKVMGAAKPADNASELDALIPPALDVPQEVSQEVKDAVAKIYLKGISGYEAHINSSREKPVIGIFKDALEAIEEADHKVKGIPVKARAADPLEEPKRLPDDKFNANPIQRISEINGEIGKGAAAAAAAISGAGVKILGIQTLNDDGTENPLIPFTKAPEKAKTDKEAPIDMVGANVKILGIKPLNDDGTENPLIPLTEAPEKPKTLDDLKFVNPKTGKPVDPRTGKPKDNHGVKINPLEEPDAEQKPPLKFSRPLETWQDIQNFFKGKKNKKGGDFLDEDLTTPPPQKREYNENGHTGPVTDTLIGAAKDIMQTSGIGPAVDAISNGLHSVAAPLITPPKKLAPEQQEATPLLKDGMPIQPQKLEKQMER